MSELRRTLPPLMALTPFEAAARLGSFSRAAEELNLSQAAISRQIRLLEDNLSTPLFVRRRYDVSLTDAGTRLLAEVGPALRNLAGIASSLRQFSGPVNQLTLFSDMSLSTSVLVPLLTDLNALFPDIDINLLTSSQPIETILEPFDIGLQYGHWAADRFEGRLVSEGVIFPVASPDLAQHFRTETAEQFFKQWPLLSLSQPGRNWISWPEFLSDCGFNNELSLQGTSFNSYSVLLDAAERGLGIALGWEQSVWQRIRDGRLVRLPGLVMSEKQSLIAHVPKRCARKALVDKFLKVLTDKLRMLTGSVSA